MTSKGLKTYLVGDFIFREGEQGNIAYVVVALVSIPNLIAMFALRKEMKLLSDNFIINK